MMRANKALTFARRLAAPWARPIWRKSGSYWRGAALPLVLMLAGCGTAPPRPPVEPEVSACLEFLQASDEVVRQAGVGDAQAARVPGFPYLRVNRFLASFAEDDLQDARLEAWMTRLRALDLDAREKEFRALDPAARAHLMPGPPAVEALSQRARVCGIRLQQHTADRASARSRLLKTARVPSDYILWQQILGIYPLTSLGVLQGVLRYHREVEAIYATPLADLPVQGQLVRFTPPVPATPLSRTDVERILQRSADNPLGIPDPDDPDRRSLFAAFAPVWEVDVAAETDRIGMPYWDRRPEVDTGKPVVFTHLSYARLDGDILLQLNYVVWFPARPRTGTFDLLGGRLDGIIWRVTLTADGRPLLYDSVHNCGCYHRFFPTPSLRLTRRSVGFEEPILVPQQVNSVPSRKVIRVASRTHSVQRVYSTPGDTGFDRVTEMAYRFRDYDELRALPVGAGYRSLFGPDGLVPHTERRERCLLWPTGVQSPGAMRQWGRHATAFVGRRYFDDPNLIERYFDKASYSPRGSDVSREVVKKP
ncbi:MAG: hypothetical protein ACFCVA_02210 [Gammaproteobacteria bacterium]